MLNRSLFLNPKLFDSDMELKSTREGFGNALVEAGKKDPSLVVLCADLKESTKLSKFAEKFPSRFIEVGVAEQNLVTVASGMAAAGKNPFAVSYAIFSPGRNWEQIRTTICLNNQPVKIIGSHGGISVGPDGATHQALEDIALMRVLPNMIVVSPCDALEAEKATLAITKEKKPCYLRLYRPDTPVMTTSKTPFEIGKAEIFKEGNDLTIIATGPVIYQACLAAKDLEESKISVRVINCHTIKPLDRKTILKAAEETGAIVTIEDHQIAGGLGSAVTEFLSGNFPVPIKMVGIEDKFGQSGKAEELMQEYNLTKNAIIKAATQVLRMKGK